MLVIHDCRLVQLLLDFLLLGIILYYYLGEKREMVMERKFALVIVFKALYS